MLATTVLVFPALLMAQPSEVRDWTNPRIDQQVITHSRTWWPKDFVKGEAEEVVTPAPRPPEQAPKEPEDTKRPEVSEPPIPFGQLGLVQRIFFDFDKSNIRPDQEAGLQKNLKWILEHPEADVLLEGHCDERGTQEYNIALGERRAMSVRQYLIRGGVDPSRIVTTSYGEERPLDYGKTEEAYAKNRRVEFFKIKLNK